MGRLKDDTMKAGKLESMLNRFPAFFLTGDQWTMLEMWLSDGVGVGSRKSVGEDNQTTFHRPLNSGRFSRLSRNLGFWYKGAESPP
jgi:hypothetical protein